MCCDFFRHSQMYRVLVCTMHTQLLTKVSVQTQVCYSYLALDYLENAVLAGHGGPTPY